MTYVKAMRQGGSTFGSGYETISLVMFNQGRSNRYGLYGQSRTGFWPEHKLLLLINLIVAWYWPGGGGWYEFCFRSKTTNRGRCAKSSLKFFLSDAYLRSTMSQMRLNYILFSMLTRNEQMLCDVMSVNV